MSSKKHSPGSKRARRIAALVGGASNRSTCECDGDGDVRPADDGQEATLNNRLSKSASELSTLLQQQNGTAFEESPGGLQQRRVKSASQHRAQSHQQHSPQQSACSAVAHKTHNFFSALKSRWARSRSRERVLGGGLSTAGVWAEVGGRDSRASDTSHSQSSTSTPHNSPRRKPTDADICGTSALESGIGAPVPGSSQADHESSDFQPQQSLEMMEAQRMRENVLRQHSFFELRIHLKRGDKLIAMDKSGTSDPYVKFKYGSRLLHKSKTVNRSLSPVWDEIFTAHIEDPFTPILVKVFDYDWGLQDDFMGCCQLDLTTLDLGRGQELTLPLHDVVPGKPSMNTVSRELGFLQLNITLWSRTQHDKEQVRTDNLAF